MADKKNDLPESPTSVTYSVVSPTGYSILLTIRDETLKGLIEKMNFIENWLDTTGYKPQEKRGFVKKEKEIKYVEGEKCPKCGGRLIEKTSKAGKKYYACEKGKYNFKTKQVEGCSFIKWS